MEEGAQGLAGRILWRPGVLQLSYKSNSLSDQVGNPVVRARRAP